MNIQVLYFSQTGNTKKVAEAIFNAVKGPHNAVIRELSGVDIKSLTGCDLLFIGSPCHAGDLSAPVKEFVKSLPPGPGFRAAGFITHASEMYNKTDYKTSLDTLTSLLREKNITVSGTFDCQGFLTPAIHDFVKNMKKLSDEEWQRRVGQMTGHPDDEDLKKAAEFALKMAAG